MDISFLQNRFDVDQGPSELNRRNFMFEERGTTDRVYIPERNVNEQHRANDPLLYMHIVCVWRIHSHLEYF